MGEPWQYSASTLIGKPKLAAGSHYHLPLPTVQYCPLMQLYCLCLLILLVCTVNLKTSPSPCLHNKLSLHNCLSHRCAKCCQCCCLTILLTTRIPWNSSCIHQNYIAEVDLMYHVALQNQNSESKSAFGVLRFWFLSPNVVASLM